VSPGAALSLESIDGFSLILKVFAFSVAEIVLSHAFLMDRVVIVSQAHVGVEHHLTGWSTVDCLPLVSLCITINGSIGSPTSGNNLSEIVVIKDTFTAWTAPGALVS